MAKTAHLPEFRLPELKLPKINLDALFSLQKANVAAAQEAQNVLVDAAQTIIRIQYGFVQDLVASYRGALNATEAKKPENVFANVQATAEKAVAAAQQGVDVGVSAQRRVVELFSQRAQANIDEIKALAA